MKVHYHISPWFHLVLAVVLSAASIKSGLANDAVIRKDHKAGFVVLAPDRGFLGNEETSDAFSVFAKERHASLIFVTDERTRKYLRAGLDALIKKGVRRIIVIPLFISAANPRYQVARQLLDEEKVAVPVAYARPYGESYFAVEDLAAKFRLIKNPVDTHLIIAGYGARDGNSREAIHADLRRIAERAAAGFNFASIKVVIAYDKKDEVAQRTAKFKQELASAGKDGDDGGNTVVVPFHFGPKFDSMMSFDAQLKYLIPAHFQLIQEGGPDSSSVKSLSIWLQHVANRSQRLTREDIGVVFLSHGSDFPWNESMRQAVQPLMKDYKIEFAFSMADQTTIERAIRKLEQRGAKAAVIVRVFALEESFRNAIERMTGLDVEDVASNTSSTENNHRDEGGHGYAHGHGSAMPAPRIRTILPIRTVGGLGSSPLFAAAMLDRAQALSRNPTRETIILIAHGSGDDRVNERWQTALDALAEHMRKAGGREFLAIKTATWREDWPDKRAPWVEKIRSMVQEATRQGGRAIVVPARITGEGPERKFLSGLEYDLASGFAPHPKFVQWVEEQIKIGMAQFADPCIAERYAAEARDCAWLC